MKLQIYLLKMATNLRLFIFLLLTATITISSAQKKPPMKRDTIAEKVLMIKTLAGPEGADYIEYSDNRRWAMKRQIIQIGRTPTAEAAIALIDLMLSPEIEAFDTPYFDKYDDQTISFRIAVTLLKLPLVDAPLILSSTLPDHPLFSQPDLMARRTALRDHISLFPAQAIRDCRAWCQEVRDGKRSFQLQGSRLRYNHLGEVINHPPPRTHSTSQSPQTPTPASSQPSLNPKTYWIIALLALFSIGGIIKLTIRKT
ncbi:hypothetical protein V2O64_21930 [Verrucomicrobiaceae bacterium 227]